jgi:actin-related protein
LAIIYGRPDSELEILSQTPYPVEKFEDIDKEHKSLQENLSKDKKIFLDKVPDKIEKEKQKLEKMRDEEKITEQEFDEKLRKLQEKKEKGGFGGFSASLKGYFVKNYSKKKAIDKIKNLQEQQESQIKEWKEHPSKIFNKKKKLKDDPFYTGAKGEVDVLKNLSHLSDDYHVLCGLSIQLPKYVTYRGRRNLRSAQMDFVVVSKNGVVLIEVKNWSKSYIQKNRGLSPHEQVDRAGMVLWIALNSGRRRKNPSVSSVLLSVRGNMEFDYNYKFVNVKHLNNINYFIENRRPQFSENEVKKIVARLRKFIN